MGFFSRGVKKEEEFELESEEKKRKKLKEVEVEVEGGGIAVADIISPFSLPTHRSMLRALRLP